MGKLSDILNGDAENFKSAWDSTKPADERQPLPPGTYHCRVESGELFNARSGTAGYKITFQVADGDHAGRRLWSDHWLTPKALPQTKRDLAKLGVTSLDQLERKLPEGRIRARVRVVVQTADDGAAFNKVTSFDVTGIDDPPTPDPFAPADGDSNDDGPTPF